MELPTWALWATIASLVTSGLVSNGLLVARLLRRGSLPALTHLCAADAASLLLLAPFELLTLAQPSGEWPFPRDTCRVFLALEVLLGTATVYLLVVINLSSATGSDVKSLKLPLLTVWLLAASLSVPDFVFGGVISPRTNYEICCLPKKAAFYTGTFRLAVPVLLLTISSLVVTLTALTAKRPTSSLALYLSLSYMAVSVQRPVLAVLYGLVYPPPGPDGFRTPPLADVASHPTATLCLVLAHYSLSAVRPLISWAMLPKLHACDVAQTVNDENQVT